MTATVESEQLYCENCSDPVNAIDEDGYGRCCHNLPNPWHRGSDGLYTQPSASQNASAEDEDEDPDHRPMCPHCGSSSFVIHAREWRQIALTAMVSGQNNEDYEDAMLWYDYDDLEDDGTMDTRDFQVSQVVCGDCSREVTGRIDVEQQ